MKVILTAKRHPLMTRPEFFNYLRYNHWPLVRDHPRVLAQILRYTQNHSILSADDEGICTPWRRADERDSVIEVWFDGFAGLDRMNAESDYRTLVAPDEAVFNDLGNNVLMTSNEELFHNVAEPGRIKRFDFLYRMPGASEPSFEAACRAASGQLALDPLFQALAGRQTIHFPVVDTRSDYAGQRHAPVSTSGAVLGAVVATWASSLNDIDRLGSKRFSHDFAGVADPEASFSVIATTFPIHPGTSM